MKQKLFAMFAATALLVGVTSCTVNDNPSTGNIGFSEQDLVGIWWDEFDYEGTTESGLPFNHVLLAVKADADHTGCILLLATDITDSTLVAVYGGPDDASFKWRLLDDGRILLSDPATEGSTVLTRGADGGSYGDGATDVSNTSLTYTDGSVTMTNGSYSGTLHRASAETAANILKMAAAATARALSEATTDDLGKIAGADGYIYNSKDAATTAGTSAVAVIAYVGSSTGDATYNHGLAIALADESSGTKMDWNTAKSTCEGKAAVTNAKWYLPSNDQWKTMFKANGGSESSYTGLNSTITTAGGTALQERRYWLSWERDEYNAFRVYLHYGSASFDYVGKLTDLLVRACLAF